MRFIKTFLYILFFSLPALSYAEAVKVHIAKINDVARVKIFAEMPINYEVSIHDEYLDLIFLGRELDENSVLINDAKDEVHKVFISDTNKLTFIMNFKEFSYRKFSSIEFVGIDLKVNEGAKKLIHKDIKKSSFSKEVQKIKKNKTNKIVKPKRKTESDFITITKEKDVDIWNFNWGIETASSVFTRGSKIWVVFDNYKEFDLDIVRETYPNLSAFSINDKKNTIMMFDAVSDNYTVTKDKNIWSIIFYKNAKNQLLPAPNLHEISSPADGVFLKADYVAEPIIFEDIIYGDQLFVVPLYVSDTGFYNARNFTAFKILPARQGITILPLTDEIKTHKIQNGLELILENKDLIPQIAKFDVEIVDDAFEYTGHPDFIPFDLRLKVFDDNSDLSYLKKRINFERKIRYAIEEKKAIEIFKYIKYLFENEFYYEAYSYTDLLESFDNEVKLSSSYLFYKAITEIALNRFENAKITIDSVRSENLLYGESKEFKFLKTFIYSKTVDNRYVLNWLDIEQNLMMKYPKKLYLNLGLESLKNNIENGKFNNATKVSAFLKSLNLEYGMKEEILFYDAVSAFKQRKNKEAYNIWSKLSKLEDNNKIKSYASFQLTKMLYEDKKIELEKAIEKINNIRFLWRGDKNEGEILLYLAKLYEKNSNFIYALRLKRQYTNKFSNEVDNFTVASEMGKLFIKIFVKGGEVERLSDFDAVTLFYEFRELVPLGKVGDEIIKNLVSRLDNLELLDRASALLEHQVLYRLRGRDKLQYAEKLVELALRNNDAIKAIEILDKTEKEIYADYYEESRKNLRVKALIKLRQYDEALSFLRGDYSDSARDLKIEIFWEQQNWPEAIKLLEKKLRISNVSSTDLDKEKSDAILRLAIGYSVLNDYNSIDNLYDSFKDAIIKDEKLNESILYLANENKIDINNIEDSINTKIYKDLLDSFSKPTKEEVTASEERDQDL